MAGHDTPEPDWDPQADTVVGEQLAAYDRLRERCPVAYSERLQWSLFRHEDVVRVLNDSMTFSNAVSEHRSVPNGVDPPEHTQYRSIIEPYFSHDRMRAFEPCCRETVEDLMETILARDDVEVMGDLARNLAIRIQCAFLGWSSKVHDVLIQWNRKNTEATLAQNRPALSQIAGEFESLIANMLEHRRQTGARPDDDITAALMHETVGTQPLSDEDIASILRNWTVGEIGTISAAVGILVHYLAQYPELQGQMRAEPSLLPPAIDEILRIQGPLVANRRIATRAVDIGGRTIGVGHRISLNWVSANRDHRVFEDPDRFSLRRDPRKNLLYGAGIHVCPGAPLARMQLCMAMEELLQRTTNIELNADNLPTRAVYPASGFATVPVRIR